MSRLILVAHVKEGIELARSYRLPEVIVDTIPRHHGTRLVRYFFSKVQQSTTPEVTPPTEENHRYPGPKPQTEVAGIIMLADTVEASSRVLEVPVTCTFGDIGGYNGQYHLFRPATGRMRTHTQRPAPDRRLVCQNPVGHLSSPHPVSGAVDPAEPCRSC